ncbi:MAG: manganese efflux pump MntP family protein [Anaerovoracaceae bacterium]|jgi:putative Mn2+ efflux pump MntP
MEWSFLFFFNSALLGVGLAMDAFTVSLANGLKEPEMRRGRMALIAGVYAVFQFAMPMIGWVCVHTIVEVFRSFEKFVPWIALILLVLIGANMIREGITSKKGEPVQARVGIMALVAQGIATSIDALSVGFAISAYGALMAFVCSLIIAVVTFLICSGGLVLGKKAGLFFAGKADIAGGLILIGIGVEIFIRGMH